MHVALATAAELPDLSPDEAPFVSALREHGHVADAVVWSDPAVDWTRYDVVLPRSCWDVHRRLAEFLRWLDHLDDVGAAVHNPTDVIRWNIDKSHLLELAAAGVSVTPTRCLPQGSDVRLADILQMQGWSEAVVKPTVSLSAYETWRTSPAQADEHQPRFEELVSAGGVLVQAYIPEIVTAGESSFVFLAGEFSHAALKHPAHGDFRVQSDFGGSCRRFQPKPELIQQAAHIARHAPGPQLFTRVDGVVVQDRLLLIEIELIDPELYLVTEPAAAQRMVATLVTHCRRTHGDTR